MHPAAASVVRQPDVVAKRTGRLGFRAARPCRAAGARRAFTLVELLAVVAMIGILAVIAIVGYRRYLHSAKTGEAKEIIGQIHVAQAAYKAETLGYLGCSSALATASEWYPAGAAPDGRKWHWVNPSHGDFACWRMLNVAQDSPTYFGFAVVAGAPGNITAVPSTSTNPFSGKSSTEPWYVVQAVGDNDKDGTYSLFVSSSMAPSEIYVENESE